jgi:GAF domain-containing protein
VIQHGLGCVLVSPLAGVEGLLGILVLGRRSGDCEFDADAVGVARRSASLLAAALERDSLQQKLQERKLMERAKGILQSRRRLSEHQAYLFLRSESRRRRLPMVDLAREIIEAQFRGPAVRRSREPRKPIE